LRKKTETPSGSPDFATEDQIDRITRAVIAKLGSCG